MGKIVYSCTILLISLSAIQAVRTPYLNNPLQTLILIEQPSNKTSTSLGILGEGIESLSSDINDLADQINLSLKSLNSQIDASISITSKSSSALLSSQIQDRQHELSRVNKMISEIEGNLAEYKDTCSDYSTCDGCVLQSSCLWCNDGRTCMPGNESGPHSGHCSSWEYATCTQSGCADHTDCEDCLANSECGWCQNGGYCMEGDPEHTGDCIKDFFYSAKSEEKDMCPASSGTSKSSSRSNADRSDTYVNTKISTTSNEAIQEQEAQLKDLKEYAAKLQSEINELESSQNEIASESESASSIEISEIDTGDALTGLSREVEDRYNQERQDERTYMEEVAEDAASEVITNTSNKVEESSQIIIDNQEENNQEVLDTMAKYSQQARDAYQREKDAANAQAEADKQQAQAEAEAEKQRAQAQQTAQEQQVQEESDESEEEEEVAESEAIDMGSDEESDENSEEDEVSEESGGDSSIEAEDGSEPVGDNQLAEEEESEESDTTAQESDISSEESATTSEESATTPEESASTSEESASTSEESEPTSEESPATPEEESGDASSDTSAVSALQLHESRIFKTSQSYKSPSNNKFLP